VSDVRNTKIYEHLGYQSIGHMMDSTGAQPKWLYPVRMATVEWDALEEAMSRPVFVSAIHHGRAFASRMTGAQISGSEWLVPESEYMERFGDTNKIRTHQTMLRQAAALMETAAHDWFFDMTQAQQRSYLEEHPNSVLKDYVGKTRQQFESEQRGTGGGDNSGGDSTSTKKALYRKQIQTLRGAQERIADKMEQLDKKADEIKDKIDSAKEKIRSKSKSVKGYVFRRMLNMFNRSYRSLKSRLEAIHEQQVEEHQKFKAIGAKIKVLRKKIKSLGR
jgi:hypothetical protein